MRHQHFKLKRHLEKCVGKSSVSSPASNKYSCVRCGRSYLHQGSLVRHQRNECGIAARFPCQLCGRKFKRRDKLKRHMEKCLSKSSVSSPASANNSINTTMPSIAGITSPVSAVERSENFDLEAEIRSVFEDIDDVNDVDTAKTSHIQDFQDPRGQQMMQQSASVAEGLVCPLILVTLNCTRKTFKTKDSLRKYLHKIHGMRRCKQYSEDSLQTALKEIMNGQSIRRSSMKHNIPRRTLTYRVKRLKGKERIGSHAPRTARAAQAPRHTC